jgi:hypothetical protein
MSDYLIHYGVKGMKWGVRKDPLSSKRAFQRAVKKAQRQQLREKKLSDGTKYWRYRTNANKHSTGRNWDRTSINEQKELNAIKWNKDPDYDPVHQKQYDRIRDKYIDKYRDAYLMDIGVSDIEAGKRFMRKHNIAVWTD